MSRIAMFETQRLILREINDADFENWQNNFAHSDKIFPPKAFGIGWSVNFHALLRWLGLLTLIFFALNHDIVRVYAATSKCHESLTLTDIDYNLLPSRAFEIEAFQSWMRHYFSEYPSMISMRYDRASALMNDPANVGDVVISFGSGPDVFSPLINFPKVKEVHLVDLFMHWGQGSGDVLSELILRLRAIHPTVQMDLIDMGFLKFTPKYFKQFIFDRISGQKTRHHDRAYQRPRRFHFLNTLYKGRSALVSSGPRYPIIFKVKWVSENNWPQDRLVFAHIMDYNDENDLQHLDEKLEGKSLIGIIVEGAPFPKGLSSYIERLAPHGKALLETHTILDSTDPLIEYYKQDKTKNIRHIHKETYRRHRKIYVPSDENLVREQNLYLIERNLSDQEEAGE